GGPPGGLPRGHTAPRVRRAPGDPAGGRPLAGGDHDPGDQGGGEARGAGRVPGGDRGGQGSRPGTRGGLVSGSLTLVWDERLTGYDFGPGHPLAPVRVELTIAPAREFGLLDRPGVTGLGP